MRDEIITLVAGDNMTYYASSTTKLRVQVLEQAVPHQDDIAVIQRIKYLGDKLRDTQEKLEVAGQIQRGFTREQAQTIAEHLCDELGARLLHGRTM